MKSFWEEPIAVSYTEVKAFENLCPKDGKREKKASNPRKPQRSENEEMETDSAGP